MASAFRLTRALAKALRRRYHEPPYAHAPRRQGCSPVKPALVGRFFLDALLDGAQGA